MTQILDQFVDTWVCVCKLIVETGRINWLISLHQKAQFIVCFLICEKAEKTCKMGNNTESREELSPKAERIRRFGESRC